MSASSEMGVIDVLEECRRPKAEGGLSRRKLHLVLPNLSTQSICVF